MGTEQDERAAKEAREEQEKTTNVKPGFANVVTADNPTGATPKPTEPAAGQPGGAGPSASSQLGAHSASDPTATPLPGQPGYRGGVDDPPNPGVRSSRKP